MGFYLNPPDSLREHGRILEGNGYARLLGQLRPGELLFGLYDRGIFKNAPWLYDREELLLFEEQASMGVIQREGFFAVPLDIAMARAGVPWAARQAH